MSLLSVGRSSKTESLIPASSRLLGSNTGDIAVARPSLACSISSDGYIHPVGAVRVMSVLAMRRQQQQQQQQLLLLLLLNGAAVRKQLARQTCQIGAQAAAAAFYHTRLV